MQRIFKGIYESVEFAKLKLLARALERAQVYEGGRLVISYLLRSDFPELGVGEEYAEGIIDYLRAVEGAEMAAAIREPPEPPEAPRRVSLRSSSDELDVSAIAGKRGGGGHRQAAGFSSGESVEEIVEFIRARVRRPRMPPRALKPAGLVLVDKPAGPSSFQVVAACAAAPGRAPATPGRSIRSRRGCCAVSGAATRLAP